MLRNIWKFLLLIWMGVVIWGAFIYTPTAKALGETTRILYFHVPCSWVATLSFLIAAISGILYLVKNDLKYDLWAENAAHLGLFFTVLATITGSIWAKVIWHSFWNWDPRETSIFILLLIYAAYFALRSAVEEDEQKARLSAVYVILAFITVPFLVFIVPRIYDSLHPDPVINAQGKIKMNGKMLQVFFASMAGFTVIFFWMLRLKVQTALLERKLQMRKFKKLTENRDV